MANTTDKTAGTIHGTDPQNLIEYITRQKIYDSLYWKQQCFGLTAELVIDKAIALRYCGGMYGEPSKPSEFLSLVLKLLQIQPGKEIIYEFITNDEFKYLRLLGAFYLRLVGRPIEIYQYLEPLLNDYRKVRLRLNNGTFVLSHIDEIVDDLLRKDYVWNISLPRLPTRKALEGAGDLGEPRVSILEAEFQELAKQKKEERGREREERWKEEEDRIERYLAEQQQRYEEEGEIGEGGGRGGGDRRGRHRYGNDGSGNVERRRRERSRSPWRLDKHEKRKKSRHNDGEGDGRREQEQGKREGSRDRYRDGAGTNEDDEIAQANALRAKLGLKPLK
jgi:pre-mRNA-splicing factor 38A